MGDDVVAPDMKGAAFIGRLMIGSHNAMVQNETHQDRRARALSRAIAMVRAAVPVAILATWVALGCPLSWMAISALPAG
jgi:hypothetical protein